MAASFSQLCCNVFFALKVHLWDLSGDTQFYDVRTELYSGTDACFLVFDVSNPTSFQNLGKFSLPKILNKLILRFGIECKTIVCLQNIQLKPKTGCALQTDYQSKSYEKCQHKVCPPLGFESAVLFWFTVLH